MADKQPKPARVDEAEVARFSALADAWWDPEGSFRPLHRLNPVRVRYIRDALCATNGRSASDPAPLSGLEVVDVGCGGGLLCEPLARLGARVTGIDPSARNIEIAANHAARAGLEIDYRAGTVEDLLAEGRLFDAVLALEVVEHVPDLGGIRRGLRCRGQARRQALFRDPQPDAAILPVGDRRRRIRPPLAAAQHP